VVQKRTDVPLRFFGDVEMNQTARQLNMHGRGVVMQRFCRASHLSLGKVLADPQRRIPFDVTTKSETIDLGISALETGRGQTLYNALGLNKTLRLLGQIALFKGIDDGGLIDIADAMRLTVYNTGETLFRQGDHGDSFFIVLQGEVEVDAASSATPHEEEKSNKGRLGPGDYFGEGGLLENGRREQTVRVRGVGQKLVCAVLVRDRYLRLKPKLRFADAANTPGSQETEEHKKPAPKRLNPRTGTDTAVPLPKAVEGQLRPAAKAAAEAKRKRRPREPFNLSATLGRSAQPIVLNQ
jgi:hypothetical protein